MQTKSQRKNQRHGRKTERSEMIDHIEPKQFEREEEDSDADSVDFDKLNAAQNRKNKKAGGWQNLGLDQPIFKGIQKLGYSQPTQIQRKGIPPILDGKDVVAMSRTGSGKTAAFVIPMLQRLKKRDTKGCRALLLSPTRELALQTFKVVKELGRFTGLRCACLVGGDNMDEQFATIHENPDVILATPGRLLHIVVEMNLKLSSVMYLVFDEADRLFEMGFADQLHEILKRVPDARQTVLCSATLPKILVDFAKAGLSDPTLVRLDVDTKLSADLKMVFATCRQNDKLAALLFLCRVVEKREEKTIVFCATQKHVEFVVSVLTEAELSCTFLYSQLDPTARKQNIQKFRNNECSLLVVTDVAARGVDIPLLDIAINFHFPPKPKLFVHRVGRVARAGKSGTTISLVTPDEMPYLADLFLYLGKPMHFVGFEGKKDSAADDGTVEIGRFPENLAHLETEFLLTSQENSLEISDLKTKAENAMKKYEKTRAPPSSESIRRAKVEFRTFTPDVHPYFKEFEDKGDESKEAVDLLKGIKSWRPNATIFEIHAGGKQQPAAAMKAMRRDHQDIINKKRSKTLDESVVHENEQKDIAVELTAAEIEERDQAIVQTFNQIVTVSKFNADAPEDSERRKQASRKRKADQELKAEEKRKHYIAYVPSDQHTESALAVERNTFDEMARQVTVDISADDDKGMYQEQKKKHWDRKTKKFVSATDDHNRVKRIRTEEGTWLPATYKSGRYDKWQQQQKVSFRRNDDDDQPEELPQGRKKGRRGPYGVNPIARSGKSELKNRDQIMAERRKKERLEDYQKHRRSDNQQRGAPGQRGGNRFGGAEPFKRGGRGQASGRKFSTGSRGGFSRGGSAGGRGGFSRGRGGSGGRGGMRGARGKSRG